MTNVIVPMFSERSLFLPYHIYIIHSPRATVNQKKKKKKKDSLIKGDIA